MEILVSVQRTAVEYAEGMQQERVRHTHILPQVEKQQYMSSHTGTHISQFSSCNPHNMVCGPS